MTAVSSRPVWLFSMDSDHFWAAPTTTGALKAYYARYGTGRADIELVHFRDTAAIDEWLQQWHRQLRARVQQACAEGLQPVMGFSMYTWNAADFLRLIRLLKKDCPDLTVIAGGPHVQQVEDYLGIDPIDLIVLGEGEVTFTEWLDTPDRYAWQQIQGLAWWQEDRIHRTLDRPRVTDLDSLPSALDVVPLSGDDGKPLYDAISYETSRGCPYRCAFCEWGTGAIGTKMLQFSMQRIRRDWEAIIAAGIKDMWLADSNFGALKQDQEKATLICDLKRRTGLPSTFATSWSKKHNQRVQGIVRQLHEHGLLPHYQLALQTLTPEALKLANRQNMDANDYNRIAREMAAAGIPIAAELIWGLPGDTLPDFEGHLDVLLATFPSINIFGYTLLPGTEFYEKRQQYRIETVPVAGYGKAHGEYVVGCHSFDRQQGLAGYFLIAAHIVLNRGQIVPLTSRWLALSGVAPAGMLLRRLLAEIIQQLKPAGLDQDQDPLTVYERRAALYLELLSQPDRLYEVVAVTLQQWLREHDCPADQQQQTLRVLELDRMLCPRTDASSETLVVDFDAAGVLHALEAMDLPHPKLFTATEQPLALQHPGGAGTVLHDPDGGHWLRAQWQLAEVQPSPAIDGNLIAAG